MVCKAFASTVEQDGAGVERTQKQKAEQGEVQQIVRTQRGIRPRKLLVGNQTCHRSDQRSQPAQIAADNQRAPVGRKAGQQQRRRYVADDLAGQDGRRQLVPGQRRTQPKPERLHALHIADENEKGKKGAEQGIVQRAKQASVGKQQKKQDDRRNDRRRQQLRQRKHTEKKPQRAAEQPARIARPDLRGREAERLPAAENEQQRQRAAGQQDVGQHQSQKSGKAKAGQPVQVEVLRVPQRCEHAAEVGRKRLQRNDGNQQLFLLRHAQNRHSERHKGDQRHVVGNRHAAEKGKEDEDRHHLPRVFRAPQKDAAAIRKQPEPLRALHYGHQAEQERQGIPVDGGPRERRFVLRNEEQGAERQQQRGGEYGFALCETDAGG